MGFDIERFINPIDDEFICAICNGVFEQPLQIFPCQHIYCSTCLNQWLESNKSEPTCPQDREVIYESFVKTPRVINNILAKFLIKCQFSGEGCDVVIKLDQLVLHESNCDFSPFIEINCEKCNAIVQRNQLITHKCSKNKLKSCIIL